LEKTGFRLPTEAEWEFVCRANTTSTYSFGEPVELLRRYAWSNINSHNRSWLVGLLKPNGLGLFDMHGNAWEWCHDRWDAESGDGVDAVVKNQQSRVLRGGAFNAQPEYVRSGDRYTIQPVTRLNSYGFRPARTHP